MQFLKNGLFDKPFMQTKIKTHSVSNLERYLGYALGPGFVLVYTTMVASLRELYYTSVLPIDNLFGSGTYMSIQTASSIIGVLMGLVINYITENTVAKAGRFRPYVLIGTILLCLTGVGMFWTPFADDSTGTLIWLWITNIVYLGVATILFHQRYNAISVSTRSVNDRNAITALRTSMDSMIPGMFVALLVMGWLYYAYLVNDMTGNMWRLFIVVPAVVAIPAAFVEYFFTRERITEENRSMTASAQKQEEKIPLMTQIKYLLTNKYSVMSLIVALAFLLISYLQGHNSRALFSQWILGATDENGLAMIYLMVAMQPMFLGLFIVPALARRFGSRIIMIVSSIMVLAGVGVCMINPSDFAMACAGGMLFSFGTMAVNNMNTIFTHQAADIIEYEYGFRFEGTLAMGILVAVYTALVSPFSALFETVLMDLGYDAFAAAQNEAVNNWILFAYYGSYVIIAVVILAISIFFDAEKKMPKIHAELKERRKAAVLARGEEWFDEEEYERRQKEEADRIAEENRIKDLKETCAKKGLDFDKENQKYLDKLAKKAAKKTKKEKVKK